MATYAEKRLVGESIVIDGQVFNGCTLERCVLVYEGGTLPSMTNNRLVDCSWVFTGAAARTIQMLGALRNGGMDEVVREIVASLDSGNPRGKVMH